MAWAPDYVTVADLRAYVTRDSKTTDDADLALAVTAASRAIDQHTNRQFGQVAAAEERKYTACWDRRRNRWVVEIDDLMTTTDLVVTVDAGTITDYELQPVNAADVGRPWTRLVVHSTSTIVPTGEENGVTIDAIWGWTAVPTPIEQATLLQGSRFFARRQSPYGVAGSPDLGNELRLLAQVDPDVRVVLAPYVRWWAAA